MSRELWDVWKVPYLTYARVAEVGEVQSRRVGRRLTWDEAQKMQDELSEGKAICDYEYGYCIKPHQFA